jgi:superfamily II helicase
VTRARQIAELLAAQRERDQLRVVNSKLRDKLLSIARECASCGGTGCVEVVDDGLSRTEDCGDCIDIRAALLA